MSVQMLKSLIINDIESVRFLASTYPACHVHTQSRKGTFGGSRAKDVTVIPVSVKLASSPIRLLSSTSSPLVKMMKDAIEMQRNKTQRLLSVGLGRFSIDWLSSAQAKTWMKNDMESQLKAKMTDCLARPYRQFVAFLGFRHTIRNDSVKRTTFNDDRKHIGPDRQFFSSYFTGCSDVYYDYRRREYAESF